MTTELALTIALIGASAGFLGAIGGSWVSARATKAAAKLQQQEAQANREEARRLRFDDRMRELAAQILDSANRYMLLVANRRDVDGPLPDPEIDYVYRRSCYELELLVRRSETLTALQGLENAQYVIYDYDYQLHGPEEDTARVGRLPDDSDEWSSRTDEHDKAVRRFKEAIRAEMGLGQLEVIEPPPLFQEPFDPSSAAAS